MTLAVPRETPQPDFSPETRPIVQLLNSFHEPFNNAIATARTCYSSRVIYPQEVAESEERRKQRDAIASSTYLAGHHTTLQHASFQFVMEKVSRQFLWSFLHAHPFYNSEQVSQRYVEVKPENFYLPDLPEKARAIYLEIAHMQMHAYQELIQILGEPVEAQYKKIFPHRSLEVKRWRTAVKKRALEVARYVLPVATCAHLYHTINGITLYRYQRLCQQFDVPHEARLVVQAMIEAVQSKDPDFFKNLEDPIALEDTLEFGLLRDLNLSCTQSPHARNPFVDEFDASLNGKTSVLIGYQPQAQRNLAQSVRSVLGLRETQLPDTEALERLLNPAKNPYLSQPLNLNSLSKLMRCLHHCHLTFRKKLSHTADSQEQRHRMTPGSRPVLATHFQMDVPDYITPPLIRESAKAEDLYHATMEKIWGGIRNLLEAGATLEQALYLLPNAFPVRFEESGDLLAHHHKWTTRLCYTAQEEIWSACRDEVLQISEKFPEIGRWLHPPCTLRKMAKETPYCPEGERFCGVRVWLLEVKDFSRLL